MIQFVWPWAFYLLPLPFILRLILPAAGHVNEAALRVPHLQRFQLAASSKTRLTKRQWPLFIYTLAWAALLTATARPQWIGDAIELPVSGRDIMMAIDFSGSMKHPFNHRFRSVSKINATKAIAGEFIDKRVGDRIGLILFGDQAYVQAPLTFDRKTVQTLLVEAPLGIAGNATAIGDAIGLAVKRLEESENREQILILLTDGVNSAGELSPEKASELAAMKGLKIHTIGIGNQNTREFNENTLKVIAQKTGGKFFRAYNIEELKSIYQLIDKLEPIERDTKTYRPTWSLYYWPLGIAFGFAGLLGLLRWRGWA